MKLLLTAAAAVAALAFAATAAASSVQPAGIGAFSEVPDSAPFAVTALSPDAARSLGVPKAFLPGTTPLPGLAAGGLATTNAMGSCGACINTCWTINALHTGSNTTTGSYWENDQPVWCGNGAWVTYSDVSRHWQTVSMWYSADGESGPYYDGGCVGCASIHFTLWGYTSWHPPIGPVSHTTLRLAAWLQAYGAAAYG